MGSDLRYAFRTLLRTPTFTALAMLTLSLGLGSVTAMFAVVNAVLLRPLPYHEPHRLVVTLHGDSANGPVSPADYLDYRREAQSFADMAAAQAWGVTLSADGRSDRLPAMKVSPDLMPLLGVAPALGRSFRPGDDQPGADRVVILSHALWQDRFGADPVIVGRTIRLSGEAYDVVGVMPAGFRFAPFWQTRPALWSPLTLATRMDDRAGRSLRVFARLRDGIEVAQAQAEMSTLAARLASRHPQTNARLGITVMPLLDKTVRGVRPTLRILMIMVSFVLLVACANVANMLLVRASGRAREIAIRAALGAGRGRIIRQSLLESLLISTCGAAGGLFAASFGVAGLVALLPPDGLPRQQEIGLDSSVFGVTLAVTVLTGLAAGLAPALRFSRASLTPVMRSGSREATDGAGPRRLRRTLVALEVALACALVAGAALMGRTLLRLSALDPGFSVENVTTATVSLDGTGYAEPTSRAPAFDRIRATLEALPGVEMASAINHLPLAGDLWFLRYHVEGRPRPAAGEERSAAYRVVQPGYFRTMRLALLSGRDFSPSDSATSMPVAIVNRSLAARMFPNENPIGRRLEYPGPDDSRLWIVIVGIAADARQGSWTSAADDEIYLPYAQRAAGFGLSTLTFVLRAAVDAETLGAQIRVAVEGAVPGAPVTDVVPMSQVVADELWRERTTSLLIGLFAAVAAALAAIGIYGMVSHAVSRRVREFGIRAALGASTREIWRLAVGEALMPVLVGAAAGALLAVLGSRLIESLLFEVSARDPLSVAGSVGSLVAMGVAAAWWPARRASRIDPMTALREE